MVPTLACAPSPPDYIAKERKIDVPVAFSPCFGFWLPRPTATRVYVLPKAPTISSMAREWARQAVAFKTSAARAPPADAPPPLSGGVPQPPTLPSSSLPQKDDLRRPGCGLVLLRLGAAVGLQSANVRLHSSLWAAFLAVG